MIERGLDVVFGDGRNLIRETAGVFRENVEDEAVREAAMRQAALAALSCSTRTASSAMSISSTPTPG